MVISCAHGLAQLAIKDLFENDEFLKELIKVRKENEYFQAVIEIDAERTEKGYIPTLRSREALPPMIVKPLDLGEFSRKLKKYQEWA